MYHLIGTELMRPDPWGAHIARIVRTVLPSGTLSWMDGCASCILIDFITAARICFRSIWRTHFDTHPQTRSDTAKCYIAANFPIMRIKLECQLAHEIEIQLHVDHSCEITHRIAISTHSTLFVGTRRKQHQHLLRSKSITLIFSAHRLQFAFERELPANK